MIERGKGFRNLWTDFKNDLDSYNLGAGIVAAIFGLSVGVVHIGAGHEAGLPSEFIKAWITTKLWLSGIIGILVASYYRLPLPMANSIPAIFLFTAAAAQYGLSETLGATFLAGMLAFIIGISGVLGRLIKLFPTPIILGMIGGVLLNFGIDLVVPLQTALIPAIVMITAYLVVMKYVPKFPPVLASLIVGVIWLFYIGIDFSAVEFTVVTPQAFLPEFTFSAFLAYGLPLTMILVGVETPAGVGILKAVDYKQFPINGVTAAGGLGTMIGSFFNLHSSCIAAPMTAITSSPDAGKLEKRWVAAVIVGITWIIVAPFYGSLVTLFEITPGYFISIIAGLALVKVLISALGGSLGASTNKIGALFAFLIAASDIEILDIGAAFWALLIGVTISLFIEPQDFDFEFNKKETPVEKGYSK